MRKHEFQFIWVLAKFQLFLSSSCIYPVPFKSYWKILLSLSIPEGKAMATSYDCKFIETSVGINHNVDELLVGLLTQIRLKLENPEKTRWVAHRKQDLVKLISNVILNSSSDLFRKRSYRKSKRRACSPLGGTCLSGKTASSNPNSPVGPGVDITNTPPASTLNRYEIRVEL